MVTRRDFLKTMSMASAGLALGAGDLLHAQTISPKKGRGDKVKIAYIGIGNRGEQIIEDFARTGMVEVVALCDVDMGAKHTQKIMAKYPKAKQFRDFRQMFDKAGCCGDCYSRPFTFPDQYAGIGIRKTCICRKTAGPYFL